MLKKGSYPILKCVSTQCNNMSKLKKKKRGWNFQYPLSNQIKKITHRIYAAIRNCDFQK